MNEEAKQNTSLGQHFMKDEDVLDDIMAASSIGDSELILEIGPGDGILTKRLREQSNSVVTVEIDSRYPADIHGNILELIDTISFTTLISNLPYHISEPLFMKLSLIRPKKIVVVLGQAFAQVLLGETIMGCVFRDIYGVNMLRTIPPEAFEPSPRVDSALVSCNLKPKIGPLADFYAFPKSKVKNYLKTKTTKRAAQEFINKIPLPLQEKRLYELNTEEFLEMKIIIEMMH